MKWPWTTTPKKPPLTLIGVKVYLRTNGKDEQYFYVSVPKGGKYIANRFERDIVKDADGTLIESYEWQAGYTVYRQYVYAQSEVA